MSAGYAVMLAMRRRKMKQRELAKSLGVTDARVSQMLMRENYNFTVRTLERIASALGAELTIHFHFKRGRRP